MSEYKSIGVTCKCGEDKWHTKDERNLYKMICMNCYEVICIDKREYVSKFECEKCGSISGTLEENDYKVGVRCNNCHELFIKLEKDPIESTRHEDQKPLNPKRCPTCQSTRIQKISSGRKILGGIGFGLMSKTAMSQFECKDCGYKW